MTTVIAGRSCDCSKHPTHRPNSMYGEAVPALDGMSVHRNAVLGADTQASSEQAEELF